MRFGANAATNVVVVNDSTLTATSPAGTGTVDITVTAPGGTSAATILDRFAYTPFPGKYQPVTPYRILDTRFGPGLQQKLQQNETRTIAIAGQPGSPVPAMNSATPPAAVVMNVTVTNPTAASYLTLFPTGVTRPTASNLNFTPGQTVPNLVAWPGRERQRLQPRGQHRCDLRHRRVGLHPEHGHGHSRPVSSPDTLSRSRHSHQLATVPGRREYDHAPGRRNGWRRRRAGQRLVGRYECHGDQSDGSQLPDGLSQRGKPANGLESQLHAGADGSKSSPGQARHRGDAEALQQPRLRRCRHRCQRLVHRWLRSSRDRRCFYWRHAESSTPAMARGSVRR